MKYVKSGNVTTKQLSISETISEIHDVIDIAKDIIQKITDKKDKNYDELNLALNNLNQATHYLKYVTEKTDIALKFIPINIQEKEYL